MSQEHLKKRGAGVPVLNLLHAPGERQAWNRPKITVFAWAAAELLFVTNPWQISSALRVRVLRLFGATIGNDVVFRPRTRVKFPWKLTVGDRCWIGEGVWIHNQNDVLLGDDVVLSQDVFLTTGSHALRRDMALITKPISIESGAWVTSRAVILGGVHIGRSSVVTANSTVAANTDIPPNSIYGAPQSEILGTRF